MTVFGTLRIQKETLSEEDRAAYRAYYCGLCKTLRKKYGVKSQLILTYDCAFLALFLHGVYEDPERESSIFCAEHMKRMRVFSSESLDYAADMNLLLAYQNYRDRMLDEKKGKAYRIAASAARHLKRDYERVSVQYPRQKKALEDYIAALHDYEKQPDGNPDFAANLTGDLMAEIFDEKPGTLSEYVRQVGFFLGKFIYLSDAFEDLELDRKTGDYNPFLTASEEEDFSEKAERHLMLIMGECTRYFEMLPVFEHREILRNILYSGIWIPFFHAKKERTGGKAEA